MSLHFSAFIRSSLHLKTFMTKGCLRPEIVQRKAPTSNIHRKSLTVKMEDSTNLGSLNIYGFGFGFVQ